MFDMFPPFAVSHFIKCAAATSPRLLVADGGEREGGEEGGEEAEGEKADGT